MNSFSHVESKILRMILALSRHQREVTATMVSDALGYSCCGHITGQSQALERRGLIRRTRVHRSRMLVSLTEKGLGIATLLPAIRRSAAPLADNGRQTNYGRPRMLERSDPGWRGTPEKPPRAILSDDMIAARYRGERYENFKGRTIVDNTPVSRPSALEGYGSREA